MLFILSMNTKLVVASLLFSSLALADRGLSAPDFLGATPVRHIDRSLTASPEDTLIEPLDIVAFKLDSDLMTEGGITQVDATARWLKEHAKYRVVLEGHTDMLGVRPYNEDLANRRLSNVRSRLLKLGINSDRIVMITYGETEAHVPENPNDRRVVMFATAMPVRAVVNASLNHRQALVATWTERNSLMQLQHGLGRPVAPTATAKR